MDDITLADLDTEEGQNIIRLITERRLKNGNQQSLDELHPEDEGIELQTTYDVFRAFIEVSNELKSDEVRYEMGG